MKSAICKNCGKPLHRGPCRIEGDTTVTVRDGDTQHRRLKPIVVVRPNDIAPVINPVINPPSGERPHRVVDDLSPEELKAAYNQYMRLNMRKWRGRRRQVPHGKAKEEQK